MPIEVYDIDENQSLAVEYGIRGVPTMIMMNENVEEKPFKVTLKIKFLDSSKFNKKRCISNFKKIP